jgi:hypothetical protein
MPPVLVNGLLYQGGKLLLAAPSKARKTWLLMHLGWAISEGLRWMDFQCSQAPVLFMDLELIQAESLNRMDAIAKATQSRNSGNFHFWHLRGHRLNLNRIREPLVSYCKDKAIAAILIDPFYRLSDGAAENSAEEIASFLSDIEEITRETGASVCMTHHFAKGSAAGKDALDRASGSGVFARDPDALMTLTEAEASSIESPLFVLEATARSFPPPLPRALRWGFPVWQVDPDAPLELKQPGKPGRRAEHSVEDILQILENQEISVGDWAKLAEGKLGISERKFKGLKAEALSKGKITESRDGRKTLCKAIGAGTLIGNAAPFSPHQMHLQGVPGQ